MLIQCRPAQSSGSRVGSTGNEESGEGGLAPSGDGGARLDSRCGGTPGLRDAAGWMRGGAGLSAREGGGCGVTGHMAAQQAFRLQPTEQPQQRTQLATQPPTCRRQGARRCCAGWPPYCCCRRLGATSGRVSAPAVAAAPWWVTGSGSCAAGCQTAWRAAWWGSRLGGKGLGARWGVATCMALGDTACAGWLTVTASFRS